MNRKWGTLLAAIAVVAGVVYFYQSASMVSRTSDAAPIYSVRRFDPSGAAALEELLADRGIVADRLESPRLDSTHKGVLIQIGTPEAHFGTPVRSLVDWIGEGNTVIQLSRTPTELMTHFHLVAAQQPATQPVSAARERELHPMPSEEEGPSGVDHAIWDASFSSQLASAPRPGAGLVLWTPMFFSEKPAPGWRPIAHSEQEGHPVVAGELTLGKGKLIVIGAPTPAINGTITEAANVDFMLAAVGDGPVLFDEWSRGVGHEPTIVGFLHDAGLVPVMLQVVFIIGLYVWSTRGHRYEERLATPAARSSIEQITTLGFLYRRSLKPEVTLTRVRTEALSRVRQAARCGQAELPQRIAALRVETQRRFKAMNEQIAAVSASHGPRCVHCGYDLSFNQTGRCPECGMAIPPDVRERIRAAAVDGATGLGRKQTRLDTRFAEILTSSHQLALEIQRDRRAAR